VLRHSIGAKDLLDTKGIKTTWGSIVFKDRVPDRDATVIEKLTASGAVLMCKLTMSEFAGGSTRSISCPSRTTRGSSIATFGSSSGPGAATTAGMVGFSIGSETGGSIVGPAANCGISGLRPTYGRVSRFGCMTLSWSLDKIGPMARSAVDAGRSSEVIAVPIQRIHRECRGVQVPHRPRKSHRRKIGVIRHEFDLVNAANQPVFAKALDALKQAGSCSKTSCSPIDPATRSQPRLQCGGRHVLQVAL
jgi:Asp-tRNA(Asn)/Glu-tRNA(Gln) amidotransferase A subunit family amidase